MTDRKLHVDTLIFIPTLKIYVFWYSRQTDRETDGQMDRLTGRLTDRWTDREINSGAELCNLLVPPGKS